VAAVMATVSPSQPRAALSQRMSISGMAGASCVLRPYGAEPCSIVSPAKTRCLGDLPLVRWPLQPHGKDEKATTRLPVSSLPGYGTRARRTQVDSTARQAGQQAKSALADRASPAFTLTCEVSRLRLSAQQLSDFSRDRYPGEKLLQVFGKIRMTAAKLGWL